MPNGKLIGKKLGDRYPGEEALAAAKAEAGIRARWDIEDYEEVEGPGGRLYGYGQEEDHDTKLYKKYFKQKDEGGVTTISPVKKTK